MTANLRAAIEQLLLRAEESEPAEVASTMLRARLVADLSGALKGKGASPDGIDHTELDDDQFLSDVAVYLEGRCSEDERQRLIDAMVRSPARRAMVESAAEFLQELEVASEPMPADLLAEAKTLFAPSPTPSPKVTAPEIAAPPIELPELIAPHIVSCQVLSTPPILVRERRRYWRPTPPGWKRAAGIAALLLVGAIGTFDVLIYTRSNDAPTVRLAAFKQVEEALSAGKDVSHAPSFDPTLAPNVPVRHAAFDNLQSARTAVDDCENDPAASSGAYTKGLLAELENRDRDHHIASNAPDAYLDACRLRALIQQAQPTLSAEQPAPHAALALSDPITPSLVLAAPTPIAPAAPPKEKPSDDSSNCDQSRMAQATDKPERVGESNGGRRTRGPTTGVWAMAELVARNNSVNGGGRGRATHDPCAVRTERSGKPDLPPAQAAASPPKQPPKSSAQSNGWSTQPLATGVR